MPFPPFSRRARSPLSASKLAGYTIALCLLVSSAQAQQAEHPIEYTNSIGMKFRLIPPGQFIMGGSEPDAPPRTVRITRPFYVAVTETTRGQWEKVTNKKHSNFYPGDDRPINYVSWYHVGEFLAALSKSENRKYRLPSEAEWEYAARAGATDEPADLNAVAWHAGNSSNAVQSVAQKSPNAFGLHDMLGNVWEWCEDFYDADYYRYAPADDPTGPTITRSRYRVLRGGSALYDARFCRFGHRDYYQESRSAKHIGFRVVLEIELPK